MEEKRKIEILNSIWIFFRNHQRYEMAAYIRNISKETIREYNMKEESSQIYLSDVIEDPPINNIQEYQFVISLIDEYPIRGHFINQNDSWKIDQYKALFNKTKIVRRILALNKLGI